jgi:hypothetical protein
MILVREEVRYGQRWKEEDRYSSFKRSFGEYVFSEVEYPA